MKKQPALFLIASCSLFVSACDNGPETTSATVHIAKIKPEQAIAVVNDEPIAKSALELPMVQGQLTPEIQQQVLNEVILRELIRQDFRAHDIENQPGLSERMDNALRLAYSQVIMEHYVKYQEIGDEELKQFYATKKNEAQNNLAYKLRHILVENENEAKELIAKINKGDSFEKLAKKVSKDNGSRDKGGDLGWLNSAILIPEFSTALPNIKKGEINQYPIKTSFGWHVLWFEDSKPLEFPAFDSVKEELKGLVRTEKFKQYVEGLKAKAKVTTSPAPSNPAQVK